MAKKPKARKLSSVERGDGTKGLSWQLLALLVLTLIAYWNSLTAGFHYDDVYLFQDPYMVGSGFGWGLLRFSQTRPLTYLTFHWNFLIGGKDAWGYHLVNVVLHGCNVALVLLIGRRHLQPLGALLAAALFAVHPLQTEAVTYIFQRASVLACFFALLSLLFYFRGQYAWSVAAYGLSLPAKQETLALPVFFLLYDLAARRRLSRPRFHIAAFGVAGLAAVHVLWVAQKTADSGVGFSVKDFSPTSYALTQSRVVWKYLRLFFLPMGLNIDHDVAPSRALLSPPSTLVALGGLLALIAALAWMAWRAQQPAVWALGYFVLLAPSSSVIPVADAMFEHRNYFPLIGLVMAVAWLLMRLPSLLRSLTMAVVVASLLAGTIARNHVWRDEQSLWTDALEKSPGKARPYVVLGMACVVDNPERAYQLLEHAAALDPSDAKYQNFLGIATMLAGDAKAALQHFQRAVSLGGETADYLNNIGGAYRALRDPERAIENYRRALALDPCRVSAREGLMHALSYEGRTKEAFLAGELPAGCHPLPDELQKLASYRETLR